MFLRLTEIAFSEKRGVFIRGDALIDILDVRKLTKVRDPYGDYCSRISFKSLGNDNDTFVRETPEEIKKICMKVRVLPDVKNLPDSFKTNRTLRLESTQVKPIPSMKTEFSREEEVFATNVQELEEDVAA